MMVAVRSEAKSVVRWLAAAIVALALVTYLGVVLTGVLPSGRRLGITEVGIMGLAILVVGALLSPQLLSRLSHVKLGQVEFELNQLREDQQVQGQQLDDLRFALTLLLTGKERAYLAELGGDKPAIHEGSEDVRRDLRRLVAIGLARRRPDRRIANMKTGTQMDIRELVEATEDGRRYLQRIREEAEPPD